MTFVMTGQQISNQVLYSRMYIKRAYVCVATPRDRHAWPCASIWQQGVSHRRALVRLDDVITVTRCKSRQFNFSLHATINHIEFEDKFLIKTVRM